MLYQRYVLSKISWHLTIADLPITWVKQNLDNIASKFICTWLEIPVAGNLNITQQSKNKFGLGIILISDRFTQSQVTLRNKLKNAKNRDICEIYDITKGKNITYDQYIIYYIIYSQGDCFRHNEINNSRFGYYINC